MSSKLEEIKCDWENEKDTYQFRQLSLEVEDIEWLIEQVEKVEELQNENTKLNKTIGKYSGKVSDLSEELDTLARELLNA